MLTCLDGDDLAQSKSGIPKKTHVIIGICHVAIISAFYFQYVEETPQGALQDFAIFIKKRQSDRLIQDDEKLRCVLREQQGWIEEKGKLASIQKVQKHHADTKREVNSSWSF